jgi:adenosylhomocysteine nucleosidase
MKKELNVGIVVADSDEYAPIKDKIAELSAKENNFFSREGLSFSFKEGDKTVNVHILLSGIGMVNAAVAATKLCLEGCDIILNAGLSGGISGISRGELMIATEYIEHDFDLTPLGYPLCKKPGQDYIYYSDERLVSLLENTFKGIKKGVAVSGDSFISDNEKKEFLKTEFNAMSCDMESAAIAYVCALTEKPFVAIRRISDDAGDDASSAYSEMNSFKESLLIDLLIESAKKLFTEESFWS